MNGLIVSLALLLQVNNINNTPQGRIDSQNYYQRYYPDLPRQDQQHLDSFLFTKYINYAEVKTLAQRELIRKDFKNKQASLIPRTVAELRAAGLLK